MSSVSSFPPYLGHFKIAGIIADYLEDTDQTTLSIEEAQRNNEALVQVEDEVNLLFTRADPFTNLFRFPKEVSNALGKVWKWRQIIDGNQDDPMVFDTGSHDGPEEPGYLRSCLLATDFAEEHFGEKLTLNFYQDLHKIACNHFKGVINNTLIPAEKTGKFEHENRSHAITTFESLFYASMGIKTADEIFYQFHLTALHLNSWKTQAAMNLKIAALWEKNPPKTADEQAQRETATNEHHKMQRMVIIEEAFFRKIENHGINKINQLQTYINFKSRNFSKGAIANIQFGPMFSIIINYPYTEKVTEKIIAQIVQRLFDEYNSNIQKAKSSNEKIITIANLFQMLEWLHPFPDGQGRTDLILMSKLLCENGFSPFILYYPYLSTVSLLDEWTAYLREGMKEWQTKLVHLQQTKQVT